MAEKIASAWLETLVLQHLRVMVLQHLRVAAENTEFACTSFQAGPELLCLSVRAPKHETETLVPEYKELM